MNMFTEQGDLAFFAESVFLPGLKLLGFRRGEPESLFL